jgi:hypothetical protein
MRIDETSASSPVREYRDGFFSKSGFFFSPTSVAGHEKKVPLKISVDSRLNGGGGRLSHPAPVGYALWIHAPHVRTQSSNGGLLHKLRRISWKEKKHSSLDDYVWTRDQESTMGVHVYIVGIVSTYFFSLMWLRPCLNSMTLNSHRLTANPASRLDSATSNK